MQGNQQSTNRQPAVKKAKKLSKADLAVLRKRLPRGFTALITLKLKAIEFEPVKQYISAVLNGDKEDLRVIEAALEVAEDHERKLADLRNRINVRSTKRVRP